ncbi:HTH DNA binding protein [Mycobacterium phage TChen]|uniref:Helix-turn-helix DNA binding domain protein n=1 Tax=Mycobacterium phage TChen TaxID=2163598 RepID=A0A2S1PCX9_9CAUD|nr:HTH DNA binding protein [Mycobacterium phage TChen]AWH14424.1 hypothetical protein SEA_TCHEN_23 [Mycobacterium phage TChen]
MDTIEQILELRDKRRPPVADELQEIDDEIAKLVRKALEVDGYSAIELARRLGITRSRVYQLRDRAR